MQHGGDEPFTINGRHFSVRYPERRLLHIEIAKNSALAICYDPGLYLGTADLSIANESESISP